MDGPVAAVIPNSRAARTPDEREVLFALVEPGSRPLVDLGDDG
jgi:hypothetical protein